MWTVALGHRDMIEAAEQVLERVRLSHLAHQAVNTLPHGDQRKLEVATLIAMQPEVFMFDEPTAGMALDEAPVILELIAEIKRDPKATVLLVEHKMDVIRSSPTGSSCCTTANWWPTARRPR
jgi:branched-chain amino acid transport system ATP-binding protein